MNKSILNGLAVTGCLAILLCFSPVPALAGDADYTARLTGEAEVPPVDTTAKGKVELSLSDEGNGIHFELKINDVENVQAAHIHLAAPGVNGPVVVWLYPSAPPSVLISGSFNGLLAKGTITAGSLTGPLAGQELAALLDAIAAGNAYVNVHTSEFGGGIIRGQLQSQADDDDEAEFTARLTGQEEVPPRETGATGKAHFELSSDGFGLEYRLRVKDIENVSAAHIHLGLPGFNGPVVVGLHSGLIDGLFSGELAKGLITSAELTGPLAGMELSVLVDAILAGNAYVNDHTMEYPGGLIRGQVWLDED